MLLESSWSLSILSWSTTMTVSMTSSRSTKGVWPLGHWWDATAGETRPQATCPPPTASTSTSGQTTPSAGQASGSDTRQVSVSNNFIQQSSSFQRVAVSTAALAASSGPPTTPPTTPSTGAACTECPPPGARSSRCSSGMCTYY